jgi:hypothetical protein
MTTAKEIADNLITKAMNMQTFQIVRMLEDKDAIFNAGVVPFDVKVRNDGRLTATVHAMTLAEAEQQVDDWINYLNEDDDL